MKTHLARRAILSGLHITMLLAALLPLRIRATEETNQFLFLTLRVKDGVVTLDQAKVVKGALKPQADSRDAERLQLSLEHADGRVAWNLEIDDPSVQRYEYEDPEHPGQLKSKLVRVDDVQFIVRTPLQVGVCRIAIHRIRKGAERAPPGASVAEKNLLARIDLFRNVTQ